MRAVDGWLRGAFVLILVVRYMEMHRLFPPPLVTMVIVTMTTMMKVVCSI